MARVIVGKCKACGKELRVKDGAVRPKMRLTCKCGALNEVGDALTDMEPEERVHVLLEGLQGKTDRISSSLCPGEIERIVKHGQPDDIVELRKNLPTLCRLITTDATPGRETIIDCLGRLAQEDATETLTDLAKSDSIPSVRCAAIRSLGNLFYKNYVHRFLAQASEDGLEIIRLPPGFAGYTLPDRDDYEEYENAYNIIFVEFTGGNQDIIVCIGEVGTSDPDELVRECAVKTLRNLKHFDGRPYLELAKTDSNCAIREIANDSLCELNDSMGGFVLSASITETDEPPTVLGHELTRELFEATQYADVEEVRKLLNAGADANARASDIWGGSFDPTPLHMASQEGHTELAKALIERGADVSARNEVHETPLHVVARAGNVELAKILIESGADVNARDDCQWTPLHAAAIDGEVEVIQLLLDRGADVNAQNSSGITPLNIAGEYVQAAEILIRHGGVDLCGSSGGQPSPTGPKSKSTMASSKKWWKFWS